MSGDSFDAWLRANPAPDLQELVARWGGYDEIPASCKELSAADALEHSAAHRDYDKRTKRSEAMTKGLPMTEDQFEDYMQRFPNPDGNCLWCGRPANQYHPVGPITITKSDPNDGDDIWMYEFCCWLCLAHWFAEQAGGTFATSFLSNPYDPYGPPQ